MENSVNTKKEKKNIIIAIILLCLIILLIIAIIIGINISPKSKNSSVDNTTEKTDAEEDNKEDERLKQLNYVNEKIDYFKDEYIDRYIAYKEENPDLSDELVVLYVNIGLDQEFYTNVNSSPNQNTNIVLVNKYYSLGEDYVPSDLENINSNYQVGGKQMTHDAAQAFNELAKDAKEEGYNIRAVSTYRSYVYQTSLYNNYVNSDGKEKADTYSARAGYSEHQTGLAVDVDNASKSYTSFGTTKEFEWMQENAYKYGFILRYTVENQFITGYQSEPWHYRYVGVEIATQMKEENISSYEEYYFMYLDK